MFGQLLEISTIVWNTLKDGMPIIRRKWGAKTRVAARMQLPSRAHDVKAIEIEATIVDKIVPNILVDGKRGLNILLAQPWRSLVLA